MAGRRGPTRLRRALALVCAGSLALTACTSGPDGPADRTTAAPSATAASTTPQPSPTQTSPAEEPAPGGSPTDQAAMVERTTALVLGTDSREPGTFDGRADVIVLVQLVDTGQLALVSVARDTYVPIPGHGEGKINSAVVHGGPDLMKDTVSELLGGVPIDHVVQVDFEGFGTIAGELGGITVDNEHADGRFDEGMIDLDATTALDFVRERKQLPNGDLDRTGRARAVLTGMMGRLAEIAQDDPARLIELAPILTDTVRVVGDRDAEQLPMMIEMGQVIRDEGEVYSVMVPVRGFATVDGQSVNLLDEDRTEELGEALRAGDLSGYVERYGTSVAPTG